VGYKSFAVIGGCEILFFLYIYFGGVITTSSSDTHMEIDVPLDTLLNDFKTNIGNCIRINLTGIQGAFDAIECTQIEARHLVVAIWHPYKIADKRILTDRLATSISLGSMLTFKEPSYCTSSVCLTALSTYNLFGFFQISLLFMLYSYIGGGYIEIRFADFQKKYKVAFLVLFVLLYIVTLLCLLMLLLYVFGNGKGDIIADSISYIMLQSPSCNIAPGVDLFIKLIILHSAFMLGVLVLAIIKTIYQNQEPVSLARPHGAVGLYKPYIVAGALAEV